VIVEKIACTRPLASGGRTQLSLSLPLAPGLVPMSVVRCICACQRSDARATRKYSYFSVIYRRRSAIPACEALRN
jgi:hypothetical protein